jgi:hypothetical protein
LAFSINEISSALSSVKGLTVASHFDVLITTPEWATGQTIVRQIPFLCCAAQLPGVGFQTTDIRPHGYGLFERRPIFTNFTTVPMTFYCDAEGNVIKFFQSWAKSINNFNTEQSTGSASNGAKMHDFQYPDYYETTIEVSQYDATSKKILTWKLNRAYPLTINNIDVSWDAENQLNKLNVEFFFCSWSSDTTTAGSSPASDSQNYNMTRIDPNASAATTTPPVSIRNNVGNLNQNFYSPLMSSVRT